MKIALSLLTVALLGVGVALLRLPQPITPTSVRADEPPKETAKENEEEKEGEPEKLPEPPKSDPKSELKALLKDKSLYLEKSPQGKMRILIESEVCLRKGLLEIFLCRNNTREHEAIVRTGVDASFIHAALVAAGGKPGGPAKFADEKGNPAFQPAFGSKILVTLHYSKNGKLHTHPAQEWILDKKTKKTMAHEWVFAGSRFVKNPDAPAEPERYAANNGELISISNFFDAMLDLPAEITKDNVDLTFGINTERIPPIRSKVWVILEPETEKKEEKAPPK